jgi:DNA sulfur modification protein DndD
MILERLVLENFRQFKGRQEIVFSDLKERNVTIVHAENGFGKTTILKALLWALYGRDGLMGTDGKEEDFEKPDEIIHEGETRRSGDPARIAASVELTFKHDDARYILSRRLTLAQQRLNPKQSELSLETMRDGQTFALDRPQSRVLAIVPEGIRGFLFFNGERINYLAMERNSGDVTEAIHQMLGLRLLKTTIGDLQHQNVRGKLRSEQRESTSKEKGSLILELDAKEVDLEEIEVKRKQTQVNLVAIADELTTIDNKLVANREAHELQARRVKLQQARESLTARRDDVARRLAKLIADDGYTLFAIKLVTRGREVVSRLRSEGKIPARVLNSFLQELLESKLCICTRCLAEGTEERKAVEALLTIAGDQDFNNAVGALDHAIGLIEGVAKQTEEQLVQLNIDRINLARDLREIDEEIEDIHQVLGGKKDEEVQQLEDSRKQLLLRRDNEIASSGRLNAQFDNVKSEIESLIARIRQIEDKEDAAARAQRRVDAADDCIKLLTDILEAETKELRPLLNVEIDTHFRKIMTKDFWAELSENYTLRIRKNVSAGDGLSSKEPIDVALSTGERTVTSLVFIASLVALAKRRSEIPTILRDVSGSAYPIAIDSPFGSLSVFRSGVARHVPELAPQVLLLVSPEQYNGQVEVELRKSGRVGKRYYLTYHGPTLPERAAAALHVNGQELQQYFPEPNAEFSKIVELSP